MATKTVALFDYAQVRINKRRDIKVHAVMHEVSVSNRIVKVLPDNVMKSMVRIKENIDVTGRSISSPTLYKDGNRPKRKTRIKCLYDDFMTVVRHYRNVLSKQFNTKNCEDILFHDLGIFTHYDKKHLRRIYRMFNIIDPALLEKADFFKNKCFSGIRRDDNYISMTLLNTLAQFKKPVFDEDKNKIIKVDLDYNDQHRVVNAYLSNSTISINNGLWAMLKAMFPPPFKGEGALVN